MNLLDSIFFFLYRKKNTLLYISTFIFLSQLNAQSGSFPKDPLDAKFITEDLNRFWNAFDKVGTQIENPFEAYIENGTTGLKDFIPYRIKSANDLLEQVENEKANYEKVRNFTIHRDEILPYYYALKHWYPYSKFPPVYFVMGRFNSGGTASDNGLIIGVEMLSELKDVSFLIIHECIHFQQNRLNRSTTLLEQSIIEGSADFIAHLVTGKLEHKKMYDFCEKNKDILLNDFAKVMNEKDYGEWLYSTTTTDRPKDIGYWVGYKISEAIFEKADDKKLAINRILNNTDYQSLLKESGLLKKYLNPMVVGLAPFENNEQHVDPDLTELTILFNQAMEGSSFKPNKDEQFQFPLSDVIGYAEDHRSFKLKLKLEPNKEYSFVITGKGFINKQEVPLKEYVVKFKTRK